MFDLSILIAVAPIASLKIGSTLNPKNIKEGSDVYFECNVRANPRSYKLTWFHEVGAASTTSTLFFYLQIGTNDTWFSPNRKSNV